MQPSTSVKLQVFSTCLEASTCTATALTTCAARHITVTTQKRLGGGQEGWEFFSGRQGLLQVKHSGCDSTIAAVPVSVRKKEETLH